MKRVRVVVMKQFRNRPVKRQGFIESLVTHANNFWGAQALSVLAQPCLIKLSKEQHRSNYLAHLRRAAVR